MIHGKCGCGKELTCPDAIAATRTLAYIGNNKFVCPICGSFLTYINYQVYKGLQVKHEAVTDAEFACAKCSTTKEIELDLHSVLPDAFLKVGLGDLRDLERVASPIRLVSLERHQADFRDEGLVIFRKRRGGFNYQSIPDGLVCGCNTCKAG